VSGSGTEHPMWLDVPAGSREGNHDPLRTGARAIFEVCPSCWGPYLLGKYDEHMDAIPHAYPTRPGPESP
jgi:hypothetical protein